MEVLLRDVPNKILRLKFLPESENWLKQNPPAEFCLTKISGVNVFVKRQKKQFTGWGLLVSAISGEQIKNTPRTLSIAINGGLHYYFTEFLAGRTMDYGLEPGKIKIEKSLVAARVSESLEDISKRGFWFTDLCRGNVFVDRDGLSYLIDIDSCLSAENRFNVNLKVSSDYKGIIVEYAKRMGRKLDYAKLDGSCINQAEAVGFALDLAKDFRLPAQNRSSLIHGILAKDNKLKAGYLKLFKSLAVNQPDWETTHELVRLIAAQ